MSGSWEQDKIVNQIFQRVKEIREMSNDSSELPFTSNNLAESIKSEAAARIDAAYNEGYDEGCKVEKKETEAQLATHPLAPLVMLIKDCVIEVINHWAAVTLPEAGASATLKVKSPDMGDWLLTTRGDKLGPIIANIPAMEKSLIKGRWKLGDGGGNIYKAPPPSAPSVVPSQPQPHPSNGQPQSLPVTRQAATLPAGNSNPSPVSNGGESGRFQCATLEAITAKGKTYWKVIAAKGHYYSTHGLTVWPEVQAESDINFAGLEIGETYKIENYVAHYSPGMNGKARVDRLEQIN